MSLFLASGGRRVVGADLTRASLELGRDAARRFGVDGALFVETDLRSPALAEGAFDVVYRSASCTTRPIRARRSRAVARLVRPGGVDRARALQRVRADSASAAPRGRARDRPPARSLRSGAARSAAPSPRAASAWLRDQYLHPEEHRHTLGEVQRWFRENDVEYVRCYPNALLGDRRAARDELFSPAEDDWWPEGLLAQLGWMSGLAAEGGLFVVIGRRAAPG